MKIGIDIDEIIVEFLEGYILHYNKKYNSNVKLEQFHSYNFWEVLPLTKEQVISLAEEFFESNYFEEIALVKGSKKALLELIKNNSLYFITSRPSHWQSKTVTFFKKHLPTHKYEIIFSSDFHNAGSNTKSQICSSLGVNVMIEDNKHYALDCAKQGISVLLLDKPWNKGAVHEKIKRVFSWEEILTEIGKLEVEKYAN